MDYLRRPQTRSAIVNATNATVCLVLIVSLTVGCDKPPTDARQAQGASPVGSPSPATAGAVAAGIPWLVDITDQVGLDFTHESGSTGKLYMPEIAGAGGAMFDFDNDGDLDIYLVNGNNDLYSTQPGQKVHDALYRQDPGMRFTDVASQSGLNDDGYGMGVAVGDYNNDGWLDVLVTNFGPSHLYRNRGDGTFEDVSESAGVRIDGWSTSATFLDYDRDGWLDLYVAKYLHYDPATLCGGGTGRLEYCTPQAFEPERHVLLHNNGDGTFTDVSEKSGIASASGHGLGVVCDDVNDDGWVDLFVGNDGDANFLWVNQRDGTFREQGTMTGVAFNMHGKAEAGMGVLAADFDNDGRNELFVTHLRNEANRLYRRRSQAPVYDEVTGACGLTGSNLNFTGFGTVAFDIELDGDLDLAIANGRVSRGPLEPGVSVPPPWDLYAERNLLYLNEGSGRFTSAGKPCSSFTEIAEVSRGLAAGDIDNDGDIDLLITNDNGRARLYRNDAPRAGHWLMVRAIDPQLHRDAVGARISVVCGEKTFRRTVSAGSSYLSSSDFRTHFGLGPAIGVDRIEVLWPDGSRESFACDGVDRMMTVERGKGTPAS